jgi:hypothetical protein
MIGSMLGFNRATRALSSSSSIETGEASTGFGAAKTSNNATNRVGRFAQRYSAEKVRRNPNIVDCQPNIRRMPKS